MKESFQLLVFNEVFHPTSVNLTAITECCSFCEHSDYRGYLSGSVGAHTIGFIDCPGSAKGAIQKLVTFSADLTQLPNLDQQRVLRLKNLSPLERWKWLRSRGYYVLPEDQHTKEAIFYLVWVRLQFLMLAQIHQRQLNTI